MCSMTEKAEIVVESINVYNGVNMSKIVSVRIEDEYIETIHEMGLKPGPFMRELLIKEIQKRKRKEALKWAEKNREPAIIDIVKEIRKDRDSR